MLDVIPILNVIKIQILAGTVVQLQLLFWKIFGIVLYVRLKVIKEGMLV